MPHHHLAPRSLSLALLALGAATLLPAATCDNQDYRALQTLTLATKAGSPPDTVVVSHPYSGRNTVDFALYNTGSQPMEVLLTATTIRSADELADAGQPDTPADTPPDAPADLPTDLPLDLPTDLSLDLPINLDGGARDGGTLDLDLGFDVGDAPNPDASDADPPDPDASDADAGTPDTPDTPATSAQQKILLGPGETRFGRFGEEDGLLGVSLNLKVECLSEICEGRLEFVVLLARLDCTQDADCASGELCEGRIGRCIPDPNADGCQASPRRRPVAPLLLPLLTRARRKLPLAALALASLALTADPSPAHAGRAVFEFPTAHLSFDGKYQTWTGSLGEQAGAGLGFDVTQSLQYRYLGFQVGVGTSYFLTNPQAPPLARGLQTYNLKLGPRFVLPLWDFQLLTDLEYQRLGVISNSLVRLTGPGLSYHGAGLGLSGRAFFGPLFVDLRLGYTQIFGFQEGSAGIFTLSLSAGIFGRL